MPTKESLIQQQECGTCSGGAKKLRFDDSATAPDENSAEALDGVSGFGAAGARSALKIASSGGSSSSLRRLSTAASTHSDVHVQLNPTTEIIEHDGSVKTANASTPEKMQTSVAAIEQSAGVVANFLADAVTRVGSSSPSGGGVSNGSMGSSYRPSQSTSTTAAGGAVTSQCPCDRFRSLLLQLSSLLLEHCPKDPEQYIVDYLNARLLSCNTTGRASQRENESPQEGVAVYPLAKKASFRSSAEDEEGTTKLPFTSSGETVIDRLASNVLPMEVGHAVLTRLATVLINAQPDDPEDFLWARLEARSFSEEAPHNIAFSADGYPVVRPDDPTQVSLLKDIPTSSPGYVVAVSLLPVLFAKKPADPISYLFYHVGSRARSNAALSAHSSMRHPRSGDEEDAEFEVESCTSREFAYESDCGGDEAVDFVSTGGASTSAAALQRKGSLGSLFDGAAAAAAAQSQRRRSDNARHRVFQTPTALSGNSMRRSTSAVAGASRASREAASFQPLPEELAALTNTGTSSKRVSVVQLEGKPRSPVHASRDNSVPRAHRANAAGANPGTFQRVESDEQARIREEFGILRMREQLRLERLQHEIRTLAGECEYRNQVALLNKSDRMADRAAAAAREAFEEAQRYRVFLCTQIDQLDAEQQRQQQLISQQLGKSSVMSGVAGAPRTTSPVHQHLVGSAAPVAFSDAHVPTELDILRKKVELLTMEQVRARSMGYGAA